MDYDYHHLPHVKVQSKSRTALWATLLLTLFFTFVEIAGGLISHSLALLSDSAHMASDVIALLFSMLALFMATRPPNRKYTFGYLRFEIIASLLNGLTLTAIAIGIFIEGIKRFIHPQTIDFKWMLIIASIGLVVNIALTVVLHRSTKEEENLNVKSALWHFIGDLLNSAGVIISALLIYFTGMNFFDPLISIIIGGVIFYGGAKIIRESYLILMDTVPDGFDLEQIRADMYAIEGIEDVHDMHLWNISSDHCSLTAHVFVKNGCEPLHVILAVNQMLEIKYGIRHTTIQTEDPAIHDHADYLRQKKKRLAGA
ncbi:cation diffusion facilitator family transporter [Weizmannia acidilactici]|uniref:cation diffusion facilitator family transporter n=1 Tax=Weizmannia acidilactici TaxID=2607726 RepID=UPI00124E9F99|nr:cation diffusion facilitator family transporter [Weizmannia acidilactici]